MSLYSWPLLDVSTSIKHALVVFCCQIPQSQFATAGANIKQSGMGWDMPGKLLLTSR